MTSRSISKAVLLRALAHYGDFTNALTSCDDQVVICIDSRTLRPGDVFLAMRGDIDDGHNYIASSSQKGAQLIIADSSRRSDFQAVPSIIFVEDTLRFFGVLAHAHLQSLSVKTIGVTGSNGKTTTKEMIKAALSAEVGPEAVYASVGNRNNLFGLPLCALELTKEHRYAIFEMGMNQVGEMERLCSIVCPDVAVITNISGAHAGNFVDGIAGVQREKGQIFTSVRHSLGTAVVNLDDELVRSEALRCGFTSAISFGHNDASVVRLVATKPFSLEKGVQEVDIAVDDTVLTVYVPLAGEHHAMNAACAIAVVKAVGRSPKQAAQGIKNMTTIAGRMKVHQCADGYLVIDDGYNANPASMAAGIKASLELPGSRRIAAIGAMGELGEASSQLHFELGELLARHFDHVFLCGEHAQAALRGAEQAGMSLAQLVYAPSSDELITPIKQFLRPNDLLFVKGSLSSNMQAIVKALL